MRKELYIIGSVLLLLSLLSSCSGKDDTSKPVITPPEIGLISGVGGFDDRGFNQSALEGFQDIAQAHGLKSAYLESYDTSDFTPNIDSLVGLGYNLILLLGYEAAEATVSAAARYPKVNFVLLDYSDANIPSNLLYCVFQVDQSAFLSGFIGAYWAQLKDPQEPIAGWIGGMDIPVIQQFRTGYEGGISYFNDRYNKSVVPMVI